MKLQELKLECYKAWEHVNSERGTFLGIPGWKLTETQLMQQIYRADFKAEIRKYGDLRKKQTWITAAIHLEAQGIAQCSSLEPRDIVGWLQNPDTPISQEYPSEVMDVVLTYPQILQKLKDGLEQLYYSPLSPSDRRDAMEFLKRLSGYQELHLELPTLALSAAS